jgi:hypothetical protein
MIVYRVITSRDILSGKTGEIIPSLRMADNRAQELANETGKEVTVTSYNSVTKAFEFIKAYYPDPYVIKAKKDEEANAKKRKLHEQREAHYKRMREDMAAHAQRMRQEHARAYAEFNASSSKPVKTKLSVAMSNLELKEGFDQATLKSNYRKMVMKHHPDKGGTVTNFQYVQKSYEYLLEFKGWK